MIKLKAPEEIEIMRAASIIVAEVLAELKGMVRPGITTDDLDRVAEDLTRKKGAVPAFKGYEVANRVFPASLCASINDEVVHGIPSVSRVLREGDIIGLDFGVRYRGFYGDAAVTVAVGAVSAEATELMQTTREALEAGIEEARPGRRIGDVSAAIQAHAERRNFAVVRDFVGHGYRAAVARGTAGAELRSGRSWNSAAQGHGAGHRADAERRRARGARQGRRVDRGDLGRQPLGALRAFGGDRRKRSLRPESAMSMPMPKIEAISASGTVQESLPNATFRVALDNGHKVLAACFGRAQDALHKDHSRGQGDGGAFAIRPEPRSDHHPDQVNDGAER